MKNKKKKIVAVSVSSGVVALTLVLNVLALGVFDQLITERVFGYDDSGSTTSNANRADGEALAELIVEEGVVLVENNPYNETGVKSLPLDKDTVDKVNVFGWSSTEWVGGGSGSGRVTSSNTDLYITTDFLEALEGYGIEYNKDLSDFYEDYASGRPRFSNGTLNSWYYQYHRLIEPKMEDYSSELLENAEAYSDTAIVVLGRVGGESSDIPKVQYKGSGNSKTPDDETRSYLHISTEEEALLEYVGSTFDNVIVLINSLNAMELGFMDDISGLDSCMVVGGTGVNAVKALPKVLFGEVSPSGRLTDTYAYDHSSAPAYCNAGLEGENIYTNSSKSMYPYDGTGYGNVGDSSARYPGISYVDYAENIYVGYKWYETAYAEGYYDGVTTDYGEGYDGVVQYPFGYGLSYSESFEWEIVELSHLNNARLTADDEKIDITVRVTNRGTVKAKEVVQLYHTPQYNKGEVEKAAMNLVDFAKTQELDPGAYQDVKLSVKVRDLAAYDCYDYNNNGVKGYEIDEGTYQLKLMANAHDPHDIYVSNHSVHDDYAISYRVEEDIHYENDEYTGNPVTNKFTGEDAIDGAPIDGSSRDGSLEPITYLSREDFEGTFPEHQPAREITQEQLEYNLYTSAHAEAWKQANEPNYTSGIVTGASYGLKVFEDGLITETGLALGGDYDHEDWEKLLDQIKLIEMRDLVLHGYCHLNAVPSVGFPGATDLDGPAQIGSFNAQANQVGVGYPNATVVGQTFNEKLAYDFGLALGKEAKSKHIDGWYGPGLNLHRTPYGGRNYEYYSEDGYLSGVMGGQAVRGAKNAGVYSYLKHLAVYDQEAYRDGLYTWLTEQAFREIYLKPFQLAIQEGGASGIMTSYNRLGGVWVGGSEGLLRGVVRDEWGFQGAILTDYSDHQQYMSMDHALRNGGDLWMDGWSNNGTFKYERNVSSYSNSFQHELRRATKNILFMFLNAYATNDAYNKALAEDPNADSEPIQIGVKPELNESWKIGFYVADVVIALGLGAWIALTFLKKEPEAVLEAKTE